MKFDKCVVCGAPFASRTGYLFMETGKSVVGMPICQSHLDQAGLVFANPVFENQEALRLVCPNCGSENLRPVGGPK